MKSEDSIEKRSRKEPPLEFQGELCPFPNPAEETVEEKNLREVDIKESTKKPLSNFADYYETQDGRAGVFKKGERYRGEYAAYLVDKFLGFDIVPTTVIRTIEGKGRFQRFIPDAKTGLEVSRDQVPTEELVKMVLFDFLINNTDRHRKNFLVKGKHIFAPDNECSFLVGYIYHRPTYFGENFFSAPIPKEISNKIIQFEKWPEGKESLSKSLEKLLDKGEVEAFFKRLEYLNRYARRGYFQSEDEYEKARKETYKVFQENVRNFIEDNKLT